MMSPGVIVTRTPLRISFAGGGTDLPAFCNHEYGAVLSSAVDKYLYVTVKRHSLLFGEAFRLNYSETEQVGSVEEIRNDIARECIRLLDVGPPLYVSTVADIPGASGLGSSASFAVGLLSALHALRGRRVSVAHLAEEAAHIEINVLKRPVGRQDHYAAAFGGLNFYRFKPNGNVSVEPQRCADGALEALFSHIMLFWTGVTRDAAAVLQEQQANTAERAAELLKMREHAQRLQEMMSQRFCAVDFGQALDETWSIKRRLASGITSHVLDQYYLRARAAGALGGKLCGAGGGGFFLFLVPPDRKDSVREELRDLVETPIAYEPHGSRVLIPPTA